MLSLVHVPVTGSLADVKKFKQGRTSFAKEEVTFAERKEKRHV